MTTPSGSPVTALRSGGQLVVESLLAHGIDTVFCVPGESFLPVLDALHDVRDRIRLIVCRHESTASHMAEAYGKATGKTGVCMVTRGPGATQAAIGVHTAAQDSTPMLLLVGQVDSRFLGRDAWQEIDVVRVFSSLARSVAQFDRVEGIPGALGQAFDAARSDRPGPAVVAMPEDVLYAHGAAEAPVVSPRASVPCDGADLAALQALLDAAERPIVIVGGGGWTEPMCAQLRAFAEAFDLPVCAAFRRQDLFDNRHPNYAGPLGIGASLALRARVRDADLVLAIGTRLGETTTSGYTLLAGQGWGQRLVHVHPSRRELGRVHDTDLAVHCNVAGFLRGVQTLCPPVASGRPGRRAATHAAHADYLATLTMPPAPAPLDPADRDRTSVDLAEVMRWLDGRLPDDCIVTNGAGNYTSWVHRYRRFRRPGTQLAPISGAMGYGLPAAIAGKLAHPGRMVVCFAGDGCMQMSAHELVTARQHGVAIVVIVVNNGMYGSIRMHQEMHFPGKVHGTDLPGPDFVALAGASGLPGVRVTRTSDFAAAFETIAAAPTGGLIELVTDPERITPGSTIGALRDTARRVRADAKRDDA